MLRFFWSFKEIQADACCEPTRSPVTQRQPTNMHPSCRPAADDDVLVRAVVRGWLGRKKNRKAGISEESLESLGKWRNEEAR